MTKIRWVVQTNLGGHNYLSIRDSCNTLGYEFVEAKVIPFSDEIPNIDNTKPTIFYGATRWINNIYLNNKWNPGVFFNPESTYKVWSEAYGKHTLNYGAHITTIASLKDEIFQAKYGWDDLLFIRPTSDMKEFAGEVIAAKSIYEWAQQIQTDMSDFDSTEVLVSEPVGIRNEWRLFMVNGKYITGSLYRSYGRSVMAPIVPKSVIQFAEERAKEYSPAPVFVMDIGKSGDSLYVVEIGCFNSAGFYHANITKLIKEISEIYG